VVQGQEKKELRDKGRKEREEERKRTMRMDK
jgi:hypothetical protein